MSRTLHISYDEFGIKLGRVTFLVDGTEVCRLANHEVFDAEVSNDEHVIRVKVGFLPVFKKVMPAGENNWSLSFEQKGTSARRSMPGKWRLYENKPFYGKQL